MPFDDDLYRAPAKRSDVARLSLNMSITLDRIADALEGVQKGGDIDKEVAEIRKRSLEMFDNFKDLTGWIPDER